MGASKRCFGERRIRCSFCATKGSLACFLFFWFGKIGDRGMEQVCMCMEEVRERERHYLFMHAEVTMVRKVETRVSESEMNEIG
jgi:hypothetical protein